MEQAASGGDGRPLSSPPLAMRSRQLQTPHTSLGTAQAAAYNCILIYYRTLIMRSFWSRPSNNGVSFRGKAVESRRMAVHFCRFSLRRVERSKKRQSAANCTLVKGSRLISPRGIFAMMFNWRDEER